MAITVTEFFQLEQGGVSGDPELGGWRPLPSGVFMPPSATTSERDTWPASGPNRARSYWATEEYLVDRLQSAHSSHPLSLQEAVPVDQSFWEWVEASVILGKVDAAMADAKKDKQMLELDLFKEHGKVNQFRATDQASAILMGGVYVSKSYLGKSTKRIRITVEEL